MTKCLINTFILQEKMTRDVCIQINWFIIIQNVKSFIY